MVSPFRLVHKDNQAHLFLIFFRRDGPSCAPCLMQMTRYKHVLILSLEKSPKKYLLDSRLIDDGHLRPGFPFFLLLVDFFLVLALDFYPKAFFEANFFRISPQL